MSENPLWALEELRNLRNPPFIADPEFVAFEIGALGDKRQSAPPSPNDPAQPRPLKHLCKYGVPLPHLIAGLPWRCARGTEGPIVSETDFVPLDFSLIGDRDLREV
jgi:hypothetical protein